MSTLWLSMWLSSTHQWAGAGRGFWTAEMQRQQIAMMNQMIDQSMRFWMRAWLPAPRQEPKRRR